MFHIIIYPILDLRVNNQSVSYFFLISIPITDIYIKIGIRKWEHYKYLIIVIYIMGSYNGILGASDK